MRTWAFVAQKGGGGKSSLAITLACLAQQEGEAALIIDMDRQGSCTYWRGVRGKDEPDVIAATIVELKPILRDAQRVGATLCLIDTAGHEDAVSLAAIRAAGLIIVPVRPSLLDVASIADTADLLRDADKLGKAIAVLNQVLNTEAGRKDADETAEALISFGLAVAKTRLMHSHLIQQATADGSSIVEKFGRAGGMRSGAVAPYRMLWAELNQINPKGER